MAVTEGELTDRQLEAIDEFASEGMDASDLTEDEQKEFLRRGRELFRNMVEGTIESAADSTIEFLKRSRHLSGQRRGDLEREYIIPNLEMPLEEIAEGLSKLERPYVLYVDGDCNLVVCDGEDDVPFHTLDRDYFDCRNEARGQGLELITLKENFLFRKLIGKPEKETYTWSESGDNPTRITSASTACKPTDKWEKRGARRVFRIPIKKPADWGK